MIFKRIFRPLTRFYSTQVTWEICLQRTDIPGVVHLGLNRPETRNAFNKSLLLNLQSVITELHNDKSVRAVVIHSKVPGVFSAGADLKERSTMTENDVVKFVTSFRQSLQKLATLPMPVIAAIDGVALGGGLELALACDIRVASPLSKLGLVETKLGIIPGAGGTQRLPRAINLSLAKELIFTGRVLKGSEAIEVGLISHVTTDPVKMADCIAEQIAKNGPLAVRAAKKAIDEGLEVTVEEGLKIEEDCYGTVVPTRDRVEGLVAFKEKRAPVYIGE